MVKEIGPPPPQHVAHHGQQTAATNPLQACRCGGAQRAQMAGKAKKAAPSPAKTMVQRDRNVRPDAQVAGQSRRDSIRVTIDNSWLEFNEEHHPIRNISASGILVKPYRGLANIGDFVRMMVHIDDSGLRFNFGADASVVRVEDEAVAFRFFAFAPGGKEMLAQYFAIRFGSELFNLEA